MQPLPYGSSHNSMWTYLLQRLSDQSFRSWSIVPFMYGRFDYQRLLSRHHRGFGASHSVSSSSGIQRKIGFKSKGDEDFKQKLRG